MQFWKRPWVLALVSAIVTSALGYATNQALDIPNKDKYAHWIIGAVVLLTLASAGLAVLDRRSAKSAKSADRLASQELLVGVNAETIKAKNLRQSSKSGQPIDQTMLKDVKAKNIDLGDVHQEQ
jgi:hypothetical protein